MSKPDFFLQFHLPMVLPDDNVLNYYRTPLLDEIEDIRLMDAIGIPMRLKCGVYQTAKARLGYFAFNPTIKLFPFSISLN